MRGERTRLIYCCGCRRDAVAMLITGADLYPHRPDLTYLPFWQCPTCGNFVCCHHKSGNPTHPLGCIPTPEIKAARRRLHALMDPIWQSGQIKRKAMYAEISQHTGRKFHAGYTRSVEECAQVEVFVAQRWGASEPS